MAKLYNLEYLEEISAGDKDFIVDMLGDFINNTPQTIAEIDQNIAAQDWDELYKTIHRFIPTFEFVGAENVRNNLRIMETCAKTKSDLDKIPQLTESVKHFCSLVVAEIKADFKM